MFAVRAVTAAVVIFGLTAGARAGVLYDNLGVATTAAAPVADPTGPLYASFTTDGSGLLNSVSLLLDNQGAPNSNGVVDVAIYNDAGNTPGSIFADIGTINDTDPRLGATPSVISFTGLGDSVTPNARYWIGLTDDTFVLFGTTSIQWERAADDSGTGVAGEFNADSSAVLPNGDGTSGPNGPTGQPYQMDVASASAPAPEPASLTVLGLGLVGLAVLRRRFI